MPTSKLTRRNFLLTGAAAAVGVSALGADGFAESNHPQIVRREIQLARLPESFDGFTIAQLSDFHYDHFTVAPIRKAVEIVGHLRPDLIVLTGDFITAPTFENQFTVTRALRSAPPCAEILSALEAPMGRFAVLGNHDGEANANEVARALSERRIPVLRNRSVPLERNGGRVWLVGVDDVLRGEPDLGAAIKNVPAAEAKILLVHEPDFADEASLQPVDLQLSGHSHGGQIWFPGIGAPWLPPLARKYPRGTHQVGGLTLYTNIGIGTIHAPVRINCPPEITLITLRSRRR